MKTERATFVWVVESGDYEDRTVDGIYSSLEKAVQGIKTKNDDTPGVWGELQKESEFDFTLTKQLQYSQRQWDITRWELDEEEVEEKAA